jgi:hypothetical protein
VAIEFSAQRIPNRASDRHGDPTRQIVTMFLRRDGDLIYIKGKNRRSAAGSVAYGNRSMRAARLRATALAHRKSRDEN